jgi:osmoprotectant transport system substrate-binding protein
MMLAAATTLLAGSVLAQPVAVMRVASKVGTEGKLLGNVVALALEANGIRVENKSSFGNTKNFA